jgi:ATP-dependent DNA helicase Rep
MMPYGQYLYDSGGVTTEREVKSMPEVAQTIALIAILPECEQDADQVTFSTLHASKGLEWPFAARAAQAQAGNHN